VIGGIACDANAGTLNGGGSVCFEDGEATLSATASGNATVPAGFSTVYVLTQGAGLVIVQTNATPEFTVGAVGNYTIHTLVYDANTLDLGIVVPGVTTGFDVNALLVQGGGTICASLDVAGAAFAVIVCGSYCDAGASGVGLGLEERIVNVTFAGINNNSPNVTPVAPAYSDFTSVVGNVVQGQTYPIAVDVSRNGAPTGWAENQVLVWIDLNQNGSFDDAGELVFTSAVGALDIYQGNVTIPAGATLGATRMRVRLHDVHDGTDYINNFNNTPCGLASYGEVEDYTVVIAAGIACDANAGTLNGGGSVCFEDGEATLSATASGNATVPAGFSTVYVLTQGAGLVIVQTNATPEFTVAAVGNYTIHTLVYDANTLDLGIVVPGVTTGFDVNALLVQGGGTICASLDVAGAAFAVIVCGSYCDAGASGVGLGLEERIVNVTFAGINNNSPNVTPVAPAYSDFTSVVGNVVQGQTYPIAVDVSRNGAPTGWAENQVLVWIDLNQNGSFDDAGELVFTSAVGALDIYQGNVTIPAGATLGATRMRVRLHDVHDGTDYINNFNNTPCGLASYGEVEDYTVVIAAGIACDANAGTLNGGGSVCFEDGEATLSATASGNATVPAGFSTVYVLTQGAGLVIVQTNATPEFTVAAVGNYTIHTLVYDANTLDLGIVVPGVTTGFDVNALLVQGGGTICASLDVAGAAFAVIVCGSYCDAGASGVGLGLEERIVNVTFAGINNNSPNVTPVAPAYSDFTSVVGNVLQGQTYPIAVDVSRNGAPTGWAENQVLVWIDYNQNGSFEDAGELVFVSAVGALDIYSGNVTIPAGSSLGATRMRVRLHDVHDGTDYINNFNNTPCGLASYGEVEDYTVVIDFTSGVEEQASNGFSIYPNPGDGNLNVLYGGVSGRTSMEVFDMTGRILHSDVRQLNNGERSTLSLSGRLAAGTYILRLTNEQGSMEQRFVVQ